MNEEAEMTKQVVGGNVFEFSTERLHLKNESESRVSIFKVSNVRRI